MRARHLPAYKQRQQARAAVAAAEALARELERYVTAAEAVAKALDRWSAPEGPVTSPRSSS